MTGGSAILFSQMEPPAAAEERFHQWYEHDHIPVRMAVPGFWGARRFEALDGEPRYLAVYELASIEVLRSDAYRDVKANPSPTTREMLGSVLGFTRFTCELVSDEGDRDALGPVVSVVAFAVPSEDLEEFDRWYDDEHVPLLLQARDWLRVRRYRVVDGEGGNWTHLALHELASTEAMASPERARARIGPLRDLLAGRQWFRSSGRWLYREISRHEGLASSR